MPSFSGLSKFFGNTASSAAGFAAGGATRRTLDPLLQAETNRVWSLYPDVPPDAYALAQGVAQGQVTKAQAYAWAKETGFGATAMDALVNIANVGPGVASAYALWRRNIIDETGFRRAIKRLGLEQEWIDDLVKLKSDVLDPADLARAIHKNLIPDPGLLATPQPSGEGKVKAYPVYDIDALAEALANGIDKERLGVMVGLQGNPMGAHEAAQAYFRGVLEKVDFDRAISEGNTRNEWGDAIMEQSRQIPTTHEFIENALRGYTTLDDALAGAAKHGMTVEDATLIYQNAGRPMAVHQITTGLARGGKFKPEPGEITDPYMASIVEGSLKPAYYDLAMANRYTLPGYFVVKAMLSNGTLTVDEAATLFKQSGWPPQLADDAAQSLAPSGKTTPDPWVTKAKGYLFTKVHKEYLNTPEYDDFAKQAMDLIGVAKTNQDVVLSLFKFEHQDTPQPKVERLTTYNAPAGGGVTAYITGFLPNQDLAVTVNSVAATITSGGRTGADGSASVAFTVPQVAKGSQFVQVSDGKNSAAPLQPFTVT